MTRHPFPPLLSQEELDRCSGCRVICWVFVSACLTGGLAVALIVGAWG